MFWVLLNKLFQVFLGKSETDALKEKKKFLECQETLQTSYGKWPTAGIHFTQIKNKELRSYIQRTSTNKEKQTKGKTGNTSEELQ